MIAIYKRELSSYTHSLMGYLFVSFLLVFAGLFMILFQLIMQSSNFSYTIYYLCFVLVVLVPFLTVKSFAEERRNKTDQLLYALPVPMVKIVLGKYLAMMTVFAVPVALLCLYPLVLSWFGTVSMAASYCSILGFFLLGAAVIALCMFISSQTDNLLIAALVSYAVILLLFLVSFLKSLIPTGAVASFIGILVCELLFAALVWYLSRNWKITSLFAAVEFLPAMILFLVKRSVFENLFPQILEYLAVFGRFNNFIYGIFDATSLIYDFSVAVFFFFLTVLSMEKRRWA